jgi:hypothetical protein
MTGLAYIALRCLDEVPEPRARYQCKGDGLAGEPLPRPLLCFGWSLQPLRNKDSGFR